ncbi:hypothetical protein [Paenibacillus sp. DMB20]|uniref:hypothetical protein n=1 Tax=Paenibacillus sp. DMB20 TaxID=1642570 RepID=UPI001364A7A6|nr:hypothetical protein [Paenibacillus sp. DMB20]
MFKVLYFNISCREFAELRHWVDENDGIDAKKELVIVCTWTEQQVAKTEEIMAAWLYG